VRFLESVELFRGREVRVVRIVGVVEGVGHGGIVPWG
jgi:hypothetical protein